MLKIAICDNESLHLCYAAELVGRELSAQQAEIEGFLSLQALLGAVSSGTYTPDLAILNCNVGREALFFKGMRAIQKLNQLVPRCRILFLAAYPGRDRVFCERERRYLLSKKQKERQDRDALKQAVRMLENRPRRTSITAKAGGKTTVIPLGDVLYVSAAAANAAWSQPAGTVSPASARRSCFWTWRTPLSAATRAIGEPGPDPFPGA